VGSGQWVMGSGKKKNMQERRCRRRATKIKINRRRQIGRNGWEMADKKQQKGKMIKGDSYCYYFSIKNDIEK
jgi:hypothetical protein